MAEFKEVLKQKERMCKKTKIFCENPPCPIRKQCEICGSCRSYILSNPDEAEKIIMNWARENPVKTNQDKFKEVFGFRHSVHCPSKIADCVNRNCNENCGYYNFWNSEYKEPKESK